MRLNRLIERKLSGVDRFKNKQSCRYFGDARRILFGMRILFVQDFAGISLYQNSGAGINVDFLECGDIYAQQRKEQRES